LVGVLRAISRQAKKKFYTLSTTPGVGERVGSTAIKLRILNFRHPERSEGSPDVGTVADAEDPSLRSG
jgi:hypothetical protein